MQLRRCRCAVKEVQTCGANVTLNKAVPKNVPIEMFVLGTPTLPGFANLPPFFSISS